MNELITEAGNEVDYRSVDTSIDPGTAREYNVQFVPTTVILDGAGEIILFETGFSDESSYRKTLQDALSKVTS